MSLVEVTLREKAIKNPEKYLNQYCEELSKTPGTDITKICKSVKDDIGNEIPAHCFTDFVENKFKNQSQLKKGKLRHKETLTKEKKIHRITNWLKQQPKELVDSFYSEAIDTAEPEIEMSNYLK